MSLPQDLVEDEECPVTWPIGFHSEWVSLVFHICVEKCQMCSIAKPQNTRRKTSTTTIIHYYSQLEVQWQYVYSVTMHMYIFFHYFYHISIVYFYLIFHLIFDIYYFFIWGTCILGYKEDSNIIWDCYLEDYAVYNLYWNTCFFLNKRIPSTVYNRFPNEYSC